MDNITIHLNNDKIISIETLDNPFISDFVEHVKYVKSTYDVVSWVQNIPEGLYSWDQEKIDYYCELLKGYIDKLNGLGLNFPIPPEEVVVKENNTVSRQLLNRLHRCFTTGENSSYSRKEQSIWIYNTEFIFEKPTSSPEMSIFYDCLHGINYAVHDIESYFISERAKNFNKRKEIQVEFRAMPSPSEYLDPAHNLEPEEKIGKFNEDQNIPMNYFKNIKQEHYQYFSDELIYDVWLPLYQIQGKDYCRAYFDYDDPTQRDITVNVIYSGCFSIGDHSYMKDPAVLDYLRSYGITPGPLHCGMPVGNIVEGKENVEEMPDVGIRQVTVNGE